MCEEEHIETILLLFSFISIDSVKGVYGIKHIVLNVPRVSCKVYYICLFDKHRHNILNVSFFSSSVLWPCSDVLSDSLRHQ